MISHAKAQGTKHPAALHGEPPEGSLAYWRWNQWPKLVRNITAWLAEGKK